MLKLTAQNKHPLAKGEISYYDINLLYSRIHLKWISLCYSAKIYFTVGSTSSGSAFVIPPNLGAKILSEYFTGNAPPPYILDPLL